MSGKDWADIILSDSVMPDDPFTPTEGSNYGLDGFDFDTEEDEGVLDGARLPETRGLAQLPDEFTASFVPTAQDEISLVDEVDGLHLGEFIDETAIEPTASLMDLDWLDPTQPQDPDRLPEDTTDLAIPELEEAWGVDRRTNGIHLVPNQDKETIDYQESLKETEVSGLPGTKEARNQVKHAIRWALRRADDGIPLIQIKKGLVARLGHMAKLTRKVVAQIDGDRGLAGSVFIHAVAYPDIHKGSRSKSIKAHLRKKEARYVIVPEGEQRLAVWEAIGLRPVTRVPWKKALRQYGPELEATGYKIASKGKARDILRRAFLRGPQGVEHVPSTKPRDIRPSERVSVQEALHGFRTAEAVPVQALDNAGKVEAAQRREVLVQVARWVKSGHLTLKQAHKLARSTVAPKMILRTATMWVQASAAGSVSTYEGTGTSYKAEAQADRVGPDSEGQAEEIEWARVAAKAGVKVKEIHSLFKWARIQMSEGSAGEELDQLFRLRFAPQLLKATKQEVKALRREHEGLSGHVYVDAGAYASKTGTKGCEKGARTHRSGTLKAVLTIDKCAGCVLQNADGYCTTYNKPLVDEPPVMDRADYQKAAIRAANASDAEVTASMFAPTFDEGEYSLTDPLQDISFHEAADPEELGEILWGDGMELDL